MNRSIKKFAMTAALFGALVSVTGCSDDDNGNPGVSAVKAGNLSGTTWEKTVELEKWDSTWQSNSCDGPYSCGGYWEKRFVGYYTIVTGQVKFISESIGSYFLHEGGYPSNFTYVYNPEMREGVAINLDGGNDAAFIISSDYKTLIWGNYYEFQLK